MINLTEKIEETIRKNEITNLWIFILKNPKCGDFMKIQFLEMLEDYKTHPKILLDNYIFDD